MNHDHAPSANECRLLAVMCLTGGFAFVAQATAMTVVIVVGARLLVEGVRRGTQRVFRVSQEIRARFLAIESRSNRYLWVVRRTLATLIYLAAALAITMVALIAAGPIMRLFGDKVEAAITRVLGVLLAALAAQYVIDGLRGAFLG